MKGSQAILQHTVPTFPNRRQWGSPHHTTPGPSFRGSLFLPSSLFSTLWILKFLKIVLLWYDSFGTSFTLMTLKILTATQPPPQFNFRTFLSPLKKPELLNNYSKFMPSPHPNPSQHWPTFSIVGLPAVDISHEWNCADVAFYDKLFLSKDFKGHSRYEAYMYLISFQGWVIVHVWISYCAHLAEKELIVSGKFFALIANPWSRKTSLKTPRVCLGQHVLLCLQGRFWLLLLLLLFLQIPNQVSVLTLGLVWELIWADDLGPLCRLSSEPVSSPAASLPMPSFSSALGTSFSSSLGLASSHCLQEPLHR